MALGEDSQKIIHFCLLVDQLVETEKFPEEEVSKRPSLFIFFNYCTLFHANSC